MFSSWTWYSSDAYIFTLVIVCMCVLVDWPTHISLIPKVSSIPIRLYHLQQQALISIYVRVYLYVPKMYRTVMQTNTYTRTDLWADFTSNPFDSIVWYTLIQSHLNMIGCYTRNTYTLTTSNKPLVIRHINDKKKSIKQIPALFIAERKEFICGQHIFSQ